MGTISATLPTIGGQRGDGEAAVRDALSALITEFNGNIESANMKNAPLVLLSTLTVQGNSLEVANAGFAALKLNHTGAPSGKRRFHLATINGMATLTAADDPGTSTLKTFMSMDHASGNVSFPEQMKKSIIATPESTSSASFTKLTTPDQVTVTLPTDGLIKVLFQATWQSTLAGSGRAAIFLGANQLKAMLPGEAVPSTSAGEASSSTGGHDVILASGPGGLVGSGTLDYTGDVATGQTVGVKDGGTGPCYIFAAAGTYIISVQYRTTGGTTVTAKNRKLWVAVEAYG